MLAGIQPLLVHCGLALALMFAAAFVGVAVTGPSVAAAERTVLVVGFVDLAIAGITLVRFAAATAGFSSGLGRVVWTLLCLGLIAVGTAMMLLVTVLSLNR